MKKFNAEKELNKVMRKKYSKSKFVTLTIVLAIIIFFGFSYAFYQINISKSFVAGKVGEFVIPDIKVVTYIDNARVEDFPTNDGSYEFSYVTCENGSDASWDNDNWKLNISLTQADICSVYFISK